MKRACAFFTVLLMVIMLARATDGPVQVREASVIIKVVGIFTGSGANAITVGNIVYVLPEYINNTIVVCHELAHVEQQRRLGRLKFYVAYLVESFISGYRNNKYEVEARESSTSNCRKLPEGYKWSGWSLDSLSFFGYRCDAFFPARVQGCPSSVP